LKPMPTSASCGSEMCSPLLPRSTPHSFHGSIIPRVFFSTLIQFQYKYYNGALFFFSF
jgi:hypothetical protein